MSSSTNLKVAIDYGQGPFEINVERSGNPDGPTVMMGHSLGCSIRMWDPQMSALEPDYDVVRIDMRGHGDSDAPKGPYTMDGLADDVIAVMDALEIQRAHWVGLSIGGMYGQSLLLRFPDRFASAVLCDTAPMMPPEAIEAWNDRIKLIEAGGVESILDMTMERWFTAPFIAANSADFQAVRAQVLRADRDGYIGCVKAIQGLNFIERLPEIAHPVRVIVGEEDGATPVSASEAIHDRIQDSDLIILENASHIANVEQKDMFNNALMEFLTQQS